MGALCVGTCLLFACEQLDPFGLNPLALCHVAHDRDPAPSSMA